MSYSDDNITSRKIIPCYPIDKTKMPSTRARVSSRKRVRASNVVAVVAPDRFDDLWFIFLASLMASLVAFLLGLLFHFQFWLTLALYVLGVFVVAWCCVLSQGQASRTVVVGIVWSLSGIAAMFCFATGFFWNISSCHIGRRL